MNKDYYSLRSDPFANRADPDVLVMTRPARRALAALLDAVAARRPVSALLGDPGTGKTTLLWALADALAERGHPVAMAGAPADFAELVEALSLAGGDEGQFPAMLIAPRAPVLLIDDADLLDEATREALRERLDGPWRGLMVVVAGNAARLKPETVERLTPLGQAEAVAYLRHRLEAAMLGDIAPLDDEALSLIADLAGGVPRDLNQLAAHLLDAGRAEGLGRIAGAVARRILGVAAPIEEPAEPVAAALPEIEPDAPVEAPRRGSLAPAILALLAMVLALAAGGYALHRWWATRPAESVAAPVQAEMVAEVPLAAVAPPAPPREPIARAPDWEALIPPLSLPPGGEVAGPPVDEAVEPPPPPPPAPEVKREAQRRRVRPGDTLFKLLTEVYGRADTQLLEAVRRANPDLGDVDRLKVGQRIVFPPE